MLPAPSAKVKILELKILLDFDFVAVASMFHKLIFMSPAKHSGTKGSLCPVSVCLYVCLIDSHSILVVTLLFSLLSKDIGFAGDTCIPWNATILVWLLYVCLFLQDHYFSGISARENELKHDYANAFDNNELLYVFKHLR